MQSFETVLAEHPFFEDMDPPLLGTITGCAGEVLFEPGEFIFREGGEANYFYLVQEGRVALETFAAGRGPVMIETLGPGDVLGWSWISAPYVWQFDARALEPTPALIFDGRCLRGKCEEDHHLGYELLKRFVGIAAQRLRATRLQLLDVYGAHS